MEVLNHSPQGVPDGNTARTRTSYSPKGRHRFSGAACPGATCLSRDARLLDLALLAESRCRKPGVRRMSLPVPVSLKRFATDFFVFCIRKSVFGVKSWRGILNPPRAELGT